MKVGYLNHCSSGSDNLAFILNSVQCTVRATKFQVRFCGLGVAARFGSEAWTKILEQGPTYGTVVAASLRPRVRYLKVL